VIGFWSKIKQVKNTKEKKIKNNKTKKIEPTHTIATSQLNLGSLKMLQLKEVLI